MSTYNQRQKMMDKERRERIHQRDARSSKLEQERHERLLRRDHQQNIRDVYNRKICGSQIKKIDASIKEINARIELIHARVALINDVRIKLSRDTLQLSGRDIFAYCM